MSEAPFRQLEGDSRQPATAFWLDAPDGVRLRAALWQACRDATKRRGTILLFPGRTEYIEKYAPVAAYLTCAGHEVISIDWRGQGLSQRLLDDPLPGHVTDFLHFQRDVEALRGMAESLSLPRPWRLLAHSMGGAIGLRALQRGLPVTAAAFSAPMWGIPVLRLPDRWGMRVATGLATAAARAGRGGRAVPGASSVLEVAFSDNLLTGDIDAYTRFMREAVAWPDMMLGTPSWAWLGAAMAECHALASVPAPDLPVLISVSGAEAIVAPAAIRARAAGWSGATLLDLPGARHEALFEVPPIRDRFLGAILRHFGEG